MTSKIQQFIAQRWRFGTIQPTADLTEVKRILNNRLGNLGETLERIHSAAEYGPVPGAYLTIPLYCDTPDVQNGIAWSYLPQDYQGFKIIGCSMSISGQSDSTGSLELDIKYQTPGGGALQTIFTATPKTLAYGAPLQFNSAGDFVSDFFAATDFRVDCSAMTDITKGLMILLYLKNVGKIEPA